MLLQVRLYLSSEDMSFRILLATGEKPEINKEKAKNGAAPNLIHGCDAAHLMLTVSAAVAEGIKSIATVHDSFACLPSQAERFRHIIREQFVRMYEQHDVLAEVLEEATRATRDFGAQGLPRAPDQGSLDIKQVLKAEFAFA
jgi:DNA-directed RNA polymerase, mitochondrial